MYNSTKSVRGVSFGHGTSSFRAIPLYSEMDIAANLALAIVFVVVDASLAGWDRSA